MNMILYTTPLSVVPGALIDAIGASSGYRDAAESLLASSWRLDRLLSSVIETVPAGAGTDYFLNARFADLPTLREVFVAIREQKEGAIDPQYPLLSHAAELVDYVSHITTNILPMTDRAPRLLASAEALRDNVQFAGNVRTSFEWSIAIYFGMSPFPLFGLNVFYNENFGTKLSHLGLGLFVYLSLALRPEIAVGGRLPSAGIDYQGSHRPVAPARIQRQVDGSLTLLSSPLDR